MGSCSSDLFETVEVKKHTVPTIFNNINLEFFPFFTNFKIIYNEINGNNLEKTMNTIIPPH